MTSIFFWLWGLWGKPVCVLWCIHTECGQRGGAVKLKYWVHGKDVIWHGVMTVPELDALRLLCLWISSGNTTVQTHHLRKLKYFVISNMQTDKKGCFLLFFLKLKLCAGKLPSNSYYAYKTARYSSAEQTHQQKFRKIPHRDQIWERVHDGCTWIIEIIDWVMKEIVWSMLKEEAERDLHWTPSQARRFRAEIRADQGVLSTCLHHVWGNYI